MRVALACLFLISLAGSGGAQALVFSGPQVGEKLPPLKVAIAYGPSRGVEVDVVKSAAGRPLLLVLVNGANRPAAQLTRTLMNYAEIRQPDGLHAAIVWLDGDPTAAEQYLQKAISWWGCGKPVGISVDGPEGPGSYGLNRQVNLTVLVAKQNRISANFALVQPSMTDAPKILAEVNKLIGGAVPTTPELVFLSLATHRPGEATWNAAPQDVPFRRLWLGLLAARSKQEADQAAARIESYVGQDAERRKMLEATVAIFRSNNHRIDGIPAAEQLKRWSPADKPK
ncbi:MAG: hypothetical protein L0Z62_33405 [Gemmataceae bacterium]|nr:hypothetical protein [Gemmataceae bacterium]